MLFKKKVKTLDSMRLSDIQYCPGAEPYQGGDEVLLCILAMIFARMVIDKLPQKKITSHMSVLYFRWGELIDKNITWIESMEKMQEGSASG